MRLILFAAACLLAAAPAEGADHSTEYSSHHPRLIFTQAEIPALQAKIQDGGPDDEAYAFIRRHVLEGYPQRDLADLLNVTFGMNFLLNLGLVAQLDPTESATARDLGWDFTLALADSLDADDNTFFCPIRLRALCFGYDMCGESAPEPERAYVRAEIESYIDSLMFAFNYERWLHPPYTSNITAMIGSSLGLAAICLAGETEQARVDAALARADTFVTTWMRHHLDRDGTCFEGVQYGTWAMRHLPYYFEARRRHDDYDYSKIPAFRRIERWLAYEILPETGGRVNNLNDTAYRNQPISRHNTFVDWALTTWSSGLSAWVWERTLGAQDGYDWLELADKASTVLWWRPAPVTQPGDVLPSAFLWRDRGLYYYRTGWQESGGSDDVVFSFYSGRFTGGHSQEDQSNFTLYGYGARLAADNGFDAPNAQSEAHNMVFVDGQGQHHSGRSVGTDGRIVAHVLSGYADYLFGDATEAYTTHSPLNNPGVPFPDDDWSYGYEGANPVERAYREWIVVHEGATPPYFVLLDDVKKDDLLRRYDWRMHTEVDHSIHENIGVISIENPNGAMLDIDLCYPGTSGLSIQTIFYDNTSADPDTRVLVLSQDAYRGAFALVLRPHDVNSDKLVSSESTRYIWGGITQLEWSNKVMDLVIANVSGDTVASHAVTTDARLSQIRERGGVVRQYAMAGVTMCDMKGVPSVRIHDGPANLVLATSTFHIDRADAEFTVYAPGVTSVVSDGVAVPFVRDGAFIRSRAASGPGAPPRFPRVFAFPQPARNGATIVVEAPEATRLELDVYDVAGRHVTRVFTGAIVPGRTHFAWDGARASSGVYFVRARSTSFTTSAKLVLVR